MVWPGNNRMQVSIHLHPTWLPEEADSLLRKPHHLRAVRRNSLAYLANPLLRVPTPLFPQAAGYPNCSLATLYRPLLHRELLEQLCLWLQYLRPRAHHPS